MAQREWRTTLIAPALDEMGRPSQVAVGLVVSVGRPSSIAVKVGGDGAPVVLQPQAAIELITNIRQVVEAKLRADGDL